MYNDHKSKKKDKKSFHTFYYLVIVWIVTHLVVSTVVSFMHHDKLLQSYEKQKIARFLLALCLSWFASNWMS